MLARRRSIEHRVIGTIDLPLLVPAFTSKGFPRANKGERSQVQKALELTRTVIRESLLLSGFDIHYKCIRDPEKYCQEKVVVFIDSGAYELSSDWDSTEPKQGPHKARDFTRDQYCRIVKRLPRDLPFAIANFDWGTRKKAIKTQIADAQELFRGHDRFLHTFIIKPGYREKEFSIEAVLPHVQKLKAFDVVGVVEKELGKDLLERLQNVARLRRAMDDAGVEAPIHIWGGLDPVITPLFFFAGAEIFDGVSWLRYFYHDGIAVQREACPILATDMGIRTPAEHVKAEIPGKNISYLGRLSGALRQFVASGGESFDMFNDLVDAGDNKLAEAFRKAYEVLRTEVPGVR